MAVLPKTIKLKGHVGVRCEGKAAAAITPGMLVNINSTGGIIPHGVSAGNAVKAFALEYELEGREISADYATNDQVLYEIVPPGAEIYAALPASAAAIVIGDFLTSNGAGYLIKAATNAATSEAQRAGIVAQAIEAVDNSAGPAGTRIKVRVV